MAFGTGILIKQIIHRGGTQDTDFDKGIIGFLKAISSAKKWGVSGGPRPPSIFK